MYAAPPELDTKVFSRLPDGLRIRGRSTPWSRHVQPGKDMHSFLEGPAFDRDGNLYCVDIPYGRIFRISPDGEWAVVCEYDGEPNGLNIHKDGRIFVADCRHGIMVMDPESGAIEPLLTRPNLEPLRACNDLFFASNGDLYFTDPGHSNLNDPTGRVFRLRRSGALQLLLDNVPYPNGLVLNLEETRILLSVTRANCIWWVKPGAAEEPEAFADSAATVAGVFIQLSGGHSGPDGLALDERSNLAVAHFGHGTVWFFSESGEPLYRIRSCAGKWTTNVAYGGPERKTLYITEAESGSILTAQLDIPGRLMYSHT